MISRNNVDYKNALSMVMARGYVNINGLSQEMKKVHDNQEMDEKAKKEVLNVFNHTAFYINDTMHSAHQVALDLFPVDDQPFIEACIKDHERWLKGGMINPCGCCEHTRNNGESKKKSKKSAKEQK